MPRVPTYDSFQAALEGWPSRPARGVEIPQVPDIAGEQLRVTGAAATAVGRAMTDVAAKEYRQANIARVEEQMNALRGIALDLAHDPDHGFLSVMGKSVTDRPSGKALTDEYLEQFDKSLASVAAPLANEWQRKAFMESASALRQQVQQNLITHESSQVRQHKVSVHDGAAELAARELAMTGADDVATFDASMRVIGSARQSALLRGLSDNEAQVLANKALERAHSDAISEMLQRGDVQGAARRLSRYSGEMAVGDIVRHRDALQAITDSGVALQLANSVMESMAPRLSPQGRSFDRLLSLVEFAESGGREFAADGSPLFSPKGAVGPMQIMPGTGREAAELAGLPWDEERLRTDPEYNRVLGRAWMQHLLRKTGGDLPKALAAYNAGLGRLGEAVARAERTAGVAAQAGRPVTWMTFMPDETVNYVNKVMRQYEAGIGGPPPPTLLEVVGELHGALPPGVSGEQVRLAESALKSMFSSYEEHAKGAREHAHAEALRHLMASSGDLTSIPPGLRANMDPMDWKALEEYADKLARRDDVATDPALFARLFSEPERLRSLTEEQVIGLAPVLARKDFEAVVRLRASDEKGQGADSYPSESVNRAFDQLLPMIGVSPRLSPTPSMAEREGLAVIHRVAFRAIMGKQAQLGRKLTDAEVHETINRLALLEHQADGYLWDTRSPALAVRPADVPTTEREAIAQELRDAGRPATEEEVFQHWISSLLGERGWR